MGELEKEKIKTSTLLKNLFKTPNLSRFIKENGIIIQTPPFHEYICEMCRKDGIVPEQIIKNTTIERTYGHQLFNGTRKPSRDKVLQLAFGFGLDVGDAQKLLKVAQKAQLYPKIMRDAVILYCIEHHMSDMDTQNVLLEMKLTLLGGQKDA